MPDILNGFFDQISSSIAATAPRGPAKIPVTVGQAGNSLQLLEPALVIDKAGVRKRKENTLKKILMVLTSVSELGDTGEATGYNVAETAHPWKVFRDSGHFVDFASIKGGQPPRDTVDTSDPIQVAFTEDETTRAGLYNTARVAVVDPEQYDAIYLVGGHGTMWDFPDNEGLQKLVSSIYTKGGIVGAVCHGPAGLLDVELDHGMKLLSGKQIAAFTNSEEVAVGKEKIVPFLLADRLEEQGANLVAAEDFEENVQVSERLVTGQNPASAAGVAKEMEKLLAEVIHQEKAAAEAQAATEAEAQSAE